MRGDPVAVIETGNVGQVSLTPPAISTVRAVAVRPSAMAMVNPSGLVATPVDSHRAKLDAYGVSSCRPMRSNSSGGMPSRVR